MKAAVFGVAAASLAAAGAQAADLAPETIGQATIPPAMQRVYVADPALPHMPDGRIYVLDAADMSLKGMMEAGFAGMMAAAPDKHRVYVATSFYERLSRGKRTDVVQVFDNSTMKVVDEISLPTTRAQALPYRNLFQLSADGSMLFVQNATPATSVTIVDIAGKRTFEAPGPGCYGLYPALKNPMRFATLCGDGTAATYTIAQDRASAALKSSAQFFDPQKDALYTHAERDRDGYVFLSYSGRFTRLAVDGETARALGSADATAGQAGWAPGGYQPFAFDPASGVAYMLMHDKAAEGSHKNPSVEIWAYDLRNARLLARSPAAGLIAITLRASDPQALFAIDGVAGKVVRFNVDPRTHKVAPVAEIKIGDTAALVEAPQ